jgi:putative nucleotidyltransferase with HDIG domain
MTQDQAESSATDLLDTGGHTSGEQWGAALVAAAEGLVYRLLDGNPERQEHSAGVAARAVSLCAAVPEDEADLLVAAAWLHDIGYAPGVRDTGLHPVDGARYLRSRGWNPAVCDLVAHHSGSRFVAKYRGLRRELDEFTFVECALTDALTVADQTVGPHGRSLSLEERMRDVLERHGPASASARAHPQREPYLRSASQRVNQRLAMAKVAG